MIKTNESQLNPKLLFRLNLKRSWRRLVIRYFIIFLIINLLDVFVFAFTVKNPNIVAGNINFIDNLSWAVQVYLHFFWSMILPLNIIICAIAIVIRIASTWFFYRSEKNKIYFKPFHYEIDEKLIKIIKNDGSESGFVWESVLKYQKINEYYILLVGKIQALFIPTTIFANKADQEQFENWLKTFVKNPKN